ncbi:hypothetical protein AABC73_06905 [Pseudomonas sp. G.S.17]|uniref:hypothetical protein n=1 Tax=Pseudomonas sp. G.S.17 TaxID=3137451 RepID=UPI00311C8E3F
MKQQLTKTQLKALIVDLSIEHHRAQLAVTRRRNELNAEYRAYFRAHGQPEPNYRGIRWDDPRYDGVILFTNDAYDRLRLAKKNRYTAKRRVDTAVRRLMILTDVSFAVPGEDRAQRKVPAPVRRFTANGESLQ